MGKAFVFYQGEKPIVKDFDVIGQEEVDWPKDPDELEALLISKVNEAGKNPNFGQQVPNILFYEEAMEVMNLTEDLMKQGKFGHVSIILKYET